MRRAGGTWSGAGPRNRVRGSPRGQSASAGGGGRRCGRTCSRWEEARPTAGPAATGSRAGAIPPAPEIRLPGFPRAVSGPAPRTVGPRRGKPGRDRSRRDRSFPGLRDRRPGGSARASVGSRVEPGRHHTGQRPDRAGFEAPEPTGGHDEGHHRAHRDVREPSVMAVQWNGPVCAGPVLDDAQAPGFVEFDHVADQRGGPHRQRIERSGPRRRCQRRDLRLRPSAPVLNGRSWTGPAR